MPFIGGGNVLVLVANTLLYLLHDAMNNACSSAVILPVTGSSIDISVPVNSSGFLLVQILSDSAFC